MRLINVPRVDDPAYDQQTASEPAATPAPRQPEPASAPEPVAQADAAPESAEGTDREPDATTVVPAQPQDDGAAADGAAAPWEVSSKPATLDDGDATGQLDRHVARHVATHAVPSFLAGTIHHHKASESAQPTADEPEPQPDFSFDLSAHEDLDQAVGDEADQADDIPVEPIFGLDDELPKIQTVSDELNSVPQVDDGSATNAPSSDDAVAPVPVAEESPAPAPKGSYPGMSRFDVDPSHLRPIQEGSFPTISAPGDDGYPAASQESPEDETGVMPLNPVLQRRQTTSASDHTQSKRAVTIAVTLIVVCVVVGLGVALATGVFGSRAPQDVAQAPAQEQPQDTSSDQAADSGQSNDQSAAVQLPDQAKSFDEYDWTELTAIARAMEQAGSREDAIAIAQKYNLVNQDGTMVSVAKKVYLNDGSTFDVRIADVYTDDLASGGKAGITFVSTNASYAHAMNASNSSDGGWESSDMRSWLNSDVLAQLPDGLRENIVEVNKLTNNVGDTSSTSSVTATADKLWIPSFAEVYGRVDWNWQSADSDAYNTILNSEGSQYSIFTMARVANGISADDIKSLCGVGAENGSWWLRTPSPSAMNHFRVVGSTPGPLSVDDPSSPEGVVVGFCL